MSEIEKILHGLESGNTSQAELAESLLTTMDNSNIDSICLRRALADYYTLNEGKRREDHGAVHLTRDYDAALEHIRMLKKLGHHTSQDEFKFYWLLINSGRLKEACYELELAASRLSGKPPQVVINTFAALARLYYKMGDYQKATSTYRQLVERFIDVYGVKLTAEQSYFIANAIARLARIDINLGKPEQAIALIENFMIPLEQASLARTKQRALALRDRKLCSEQTNAYKVDTNALTVVCVKHGTKYGPEYVNRLYSMVRRYLSGNWQFVCMTDDPSGLLPQVETMDISQIKVSGWWAKVAMFDVRLPFKHDTVLYLDLDTVVVGSLDFIGDLKVGFYIFEHSDAPSFNSSVMLFDRKFAEPIYKSLTRQAVNSLPGDQEWVEECIPNANTFSPELISMYRSLEPDMVTNDILDSPARLITFPSNPKPHQMSSGWVKDLWN